ncbi:MAG: AcrB/AcrD/AcrF family protein, partial [Proteobacteria bacterium]|nr:AcrB/AcrD/AcrF family protein [Pseudomonadota bacterium]
VPAGVKLAITSDLSKDIRIMLNDLQNNILSGLVLVLAVIFSFIGGLSALFVAMAIPLSMLISFGVLQGLGITLNMVVLFSLILALGMLVDNGIVIVENIYRHIQDGED